MNWRGRHNRWARHKEHSKLIADFWAGLSKAARRKVRKELEERLARWLGWRWFVEERMAKEAFTERHARPEHDAYVRRQRAHRDEVKGFRR